MIGRDRDAGRGPSEPDDLLDRRQFLRRGGSTVAALGTAALLGPLAGCSSATSTGSSSTTAYKRHGDHGNHHRSTGVVGPVGHAERVAGGGRKPDLPDEP